MPSSNTTSPSSSPTPSPMRANNPSSSLRVLPAEDKASLGPMEPSVSTSSTRRSKLVIWPTWVFSTR